MHAFNVDLATTFTCRRVEYFLEVEVDRVRDCKETRSDRTSCTFCCPEISGLALVCARLRTGPWPCIVHRYARYARLGVELAIDEVWPEKSTGLEKRRRLKDSGRFPDTYIINTKNYWK